MKYELSQQDSFCFSGVLCEVYESSKIEIIYKNNCIIVDMQNVKLGFQSPLEKQTQ